MDIGEIVERDSEVKPPAPPKQPRLKSLPKAWRPSRARGPGIAPAQAPGAAPPAPEQPPLTESEQIHIENVKKLASMSPDEMEREREEIFQSMDASVLQGLLKRIELKEAGTAQKTADPLSTTDTLPDQVEFKPSPLKVDEEQKANISNLPETESVAQMSHSHDHQGETLHFPSPPDDLKKYFPDLPVETEKMAWMQPISTEEENEYSADLTSVAPSEIRFDFNGNLLTPRQSRAIDGSKGLHHHGDAPSAAGYTILELAHLARSSHPAQRSMAIQTLGRVLHKLYLGKFRKSSDLQGGLEQLVESGRVMDTLYEAAGERTRSVTVRTLATEALWLIETVKPSKPTT
ncbi:RNA polymerase II-associated protein RBA50 [Wickerhamiella sorbophila]|uniref:RNA polymerase II-associated protein RBA50 n=1 Tax=Wickerhamiella sorbophila TaxID=45607 RepID=A0A2T0FP55_9ASCO|nr:RNA polymerase II-associated protein RBA50 [Wickerhamiella sorbophila]PRT56772.1 RNA polymerase II-associated protein RBA50 [Wickerhamiella sorbophila]